MLGPGLVLARGARSDVRVRRSARELRHKVIAFIKQ